MTYHKYILTTLENTQPVIDNLINIGCKSRELKLIETTYNERQEPIYQMDCIGCDCKTTLAK